MPTNLNKRKGPHPGKFGHSSPTQDDGKFTRFSHHNPHGLRSWCQTSPTRDHHLHSKKIKENCSALILRGHKKLESVGLVRWDSSRRSFYPKRTNCSVLAGHEYQRWRTSCLTSVVSSNLENILARLFSKINSPTGCASSRGSVVGGKI